MRKADEVNRRAILKTIGVTGATTSLFGSVVSGRGILGRDVSQLHGTRRTEILNTVQTDQDFREIVATIRNRDWVPNYKNSITNRVQSEIEGEFYDYVVVPFEPQRKENTSQTQITGFWTNRTMDDVPLPKTFGHIATPVVSSRGGDEDTIDLASQGWDIELYTPNAGNIKHETHSVIYGEVSDSVTTASGDGCVVELVQCEEWDWLCIVSIAASIIGSAAACSSCLMAPNPISCGLCLVVLGGGAGTASCAQDGDPLKDCETTTMWVDKDDLPDEFDYPDECHCCVS